MSETKVCPECGHEFLHGWDGIDAHWRSKHHHVMSYERAWPLLQSGQYKKQSRREDVVPILCKFWADREEDVWNGVTEHLAVAVFGASLPEAQKNLADGIVSHLEGLREIGELETALEHLRICAKEFLSVEDIPTGKVYSRLEARVTDTAVLAFA